MLASTVQREMIMYVSVVPRLAALPMLTRNTPPLTEYPEMMEEIVLSSNVTLSPDVYIAATLMLFPFAPNRVCTKLMCVKKELGAPVIPIPYPYFWNVARVVTFTSPTQRWPYTLLNSPYIVSTVPPRSTDI